MSKKWYFNANPKALGTQGTSYSIGFTSSGEHFSVLRNGTVFKEKFYLYYDDTQTYKSGWTNSAYRTVTFDEEPTGALLTYLEANATAVAEDPFKFKHLYKNASLIGSGTYKFRPYTVAEPRLATPTNVAANGTTVSWDDVANAESYDIYVDGTLYENTTASTELTAPFVKLSFTWTDTGFPDWEDQTVYVMAKATSTPPKSTSEATIIGTLSINKDKELCYAEFDLSNYEGKYLFIAAHGYTDNYCRSGHAQTDSGDVSTTYNTWSGSTWTDLTNSRQYELGVISSTTTVLVYGEYLNED